VSWLSECRGLDRRVWALAAARMVVTAGYSVVMPFLAMHLAVERHVPVVTVGAIWFAAGGCGALAQWLAGELCDRVGRRPVMLGAMLLRAANLAAMGYTIDRLAPGAPATPGWILVIALLTVMNAVLRGFFDPVATALVADLAPPASRVAAYSLQRVGVNLGWATGLGVATAAAGISYPVLFYASVPLTLLSALGIANIRDTGVQPNRRAFTAGELLAFARDRTLLRFLLATLAFYVLQVQLYQTTSIYAASVLHMTRGDVAMVYTLNGVMVVLLQLPAIRAIQRLGTRRALVIGSLGYAVAYAAVGTARGSGTLLVCVGAVTLAEILTSPAQQAAITSLAPPGRTGAYTGLAGLCQVVGQSTGPLIGTTLLAALPPRNAWFVMALFGVGAALGYRATYALAASPAARSATESAAEAAAEAATEVATELAANSGPTPPHNPLARKG
jgi:MFS family permease